MWVLEYEIAWATVETKYSDPWKRGVPPRLALYLNDEGRSQYKSSLKFSEECLRSSIAGKEGNQYLKAGRRHFVSGTRPLRSCQTFPSVYLVYSVRGFGYGGLCFYQLCHSLGTCFHDLVHIYHSIAHLQVCSHLGSSVNMRFSTLSPERERGLFHTVTKQLQ